MNDKFFIGIALGMVGGAILATHSQKTREIVKDGENEVKQKVKSMTSTKKNSKN